MFLFLNKWQSALDRETRSSIELACLYEKGTAVPAANTYPPEHPYDPQAQGRRPRQCSQ